MYSILQIIVQKIKTINEIPNNNYRQKLTSPHKLFKYNRKSKTKKAIRAIGYLLNLSKHIIDHDLNYMPWYSLSTWANGQEKNQNVQNENNNDTNVNYEIFIVDKNSSNQQYIIHNFAVDYQHKPIYFNFLCPYEFSST